MPYIKTESDKVLAWVDDDYQDFVSLEDYIIDCDLCERPLASIEKCDGYKMQFPKADEIVSNFIEELYEDGITPEDWDEIDIKNHLTDLDWFKEEYNKLVNEFNRRQKDEVWQSNGIFVYPQYFKAEIYGTEPEIVKVEDGSYNGQEEIAEVIDRINERTKQQLINGLKTELTEEFTKNKELSKEQKEKIKESVKEYFKQHPDLEVPTNEESGLPFWEDDYFMNFSED